MHAVGVITLYSKGNSYISLMSNICGVKTILHYVTEIIKLNLAMCYFINSLYPPTIYPSVRNAPVSDENGLTYFHRTVAQSY